MSDMEREAVLFIHSAATGPFLWSGVSDEAVGSRRRLLPANIGYPPNPPIPRGTRVDIADEVAHLEAAIPSDVDRVHVVAHSYGALVALRLILALGDRVASIFLYEPVLFGTLANDAQADRAAVSEAQAFIAHPWFFHDEEKAGSEEWLEIFIDYWNNRPGAWRKLPGPMRDLCLAVGWKMFQEVRACLLENRSFSAWKLGAETTLVRGERSPMQSREMTGALARERDNVTLVDLPGVGHMAPLTHPATVHEVLARHMARVMTR